MPKEKDYVLGTTEEEIARLGLQHRVWRPRVLEAWRRAGFRAGQTILDVGCGPGYAALDLAEIVGSTGKVVAIERSRRFLNALSSAAAAGGISNVEIRELDLDVVNLAFADPPIREADGAWCRWVLSFVKRPRAVLAGVAEAIRPGGVIVLHEYFDYSTWRMAPRSEPIEEFVATVMKSWREDGGEPDIALELPRWLGELGYSVRSILPIVEAVSRDNPIWEWPAAFLEVNLSRLVDLGHLTPGRAEEIRHAFREAAAASGTFMITPGVLEIVAIRG